MKSIAENRKVKLVDLQGQCELNYVRLERLFPDMRVSLNKKVVAGHEDLFRLQLHVSERSRYTTRLWISGSIVGLPWAEKLDMDIQVYHDAKMAEVTHSDSIRLLNFRNDYPNAMALQPNEKWNANHFLGEWLAYFMQRGRSAGILGSDITKDLL